MVALPPCGEILQPKAYHAIAYFKGATGAVLSILNDECHECSYWDTCVLDGKKNGAYVLTRQANNFRYIVNGTTTAEGKYSFGNLGIYEVEPNNGSAFTVRVVAEPSFLSVLYILPFLLTLLPLVIDRGYEIARAFYLKQLGRPYEEPEYDEYGHRINRPAPSRQQFLDALRGFALILMIFVNYGGGGLPLMAHSAWYGLTIADIVFPLFLYCSGISLFFTYWRTTQYTRYHYWRMSFRCGRLIVIGIVLSNFAGKSVRVPGVLQRIGFVILVFFMAHAALTHALTRIHRLDMYNRWFDSSYSEFVDMGIALSAALIYIFLMAIPTINCPMFYGGPGGISDHGAYKDCAGGFGGALDAFVFGKFLYQTPTSRELYHTTEPYDPEGILGSISAIITLCSGFLAIHLIHGENPSKNWGYSAITIVLLLAGFGMHHSIQPICKNTWNLSYVLVNAGLDNIFLLLIYKLSDYGRGQTWKFRTLTVMGKNSLLIYICHEVCVGRFPVQFNVGPSIVLQLLNATWGVTFHVILAYIMEWGKFRINFDVSLGINRYQLVLS